MGEDRQAYFERRAREARDLAAKATEERVRRIHTELARRYAERARDPDADIAPDATST